MRLILFSVLLLTSHFSQAMIFGPNNIIDVSISDASRASRLGASVAIMVGDVYLEQDKIKNNYYLDFIEATSPHNIGLCKEEKFSGQYTAWVNCSGFLVGEDLMVTAGHCATFNMEVIDHEVKGTCATFKWIFDYTGDHGKFELSDFPADNIYSCKQVIHAEHLAFVQDHHGNLVPPPNGNHGTDFAIIQLDRPVKHRKPLKLATREPQKGDYLVGLGYPMALPLKESAGGFVLVESATYDDFILTDLDIIGGNSGGPVFNLNDEVIGIAVRSFPHEDFNYHADRRCSTLITCPKMGQGDCIEPGYILGTHLDKIKHVQQWLPKL